MVKPWKPLERETRSVHLVVQSSLNRSPNEPPIELSTPLVVVVVEKVDVSEVEVIEVRVVVIVPDLSSAWVPPWFTCMCLGSEPTV